MIASTKFVAGFYSNEHHYYITDDDKWFVSWYLKINFFKR